MSIKKAIKRANKLSHTLIGQDYILPVNECRYLVLRTEPKFLKNTDKIISDKPTFVKQWKKPRPHGYISMNHISYYITKMGLPQNVVNHYIRRSRYFRTGIIYFIHYTTGD